MKYITLSNLLIFFGLSSIAFAAALPPTKCPSIEAIKSSKSHLWINKSGSNNYIAFQDDQKFDTDKMWAITVWNIDSTSMDDAEQKAKSALATVTYQRGPEQQSSEVWRCIYDTAYGYKTVTYTSS